MSPFSRRKHPFYIRLADETLRNALGVDQHKHLLDQEVRRWGSRRVERNTSEREHFAAFGDDDCAAERIPRTTVGLGIDHPELFLDAALDARSLYVRSSHEVMRDSSSGQLRSWPDNLEVAVYCFALLF